METNLAAQVKPSQFHGKESLQAPLLPEAMLRNYFRAKDENRPHLLANVFSAAATLEIHNRSSTIVFPAVTTGRDAIADVLVRSFGQTYENVYSFYLDKPPSAVRAFSSRWLVAMSEKLTRNTRVGCGRYDWTFEVDPPHLARHLAITIEVMQVLAPDDWSTVHAWLQHLDYPWSSAASARDSAPSIGQLAPVIQYLERT